MNNRSTLLSALAVVAMLVATVGSTALPARTTDSTKQTVKPSKSSDELQRTYRQVFDVQDNVVSRFQFKITNYGIWGFDIANGRGAGIWPRGSQNQYMFAAGPWFGALKRPTGSENLRKLCLIGYNSSSGDGWCVPGSIDDGTTVANTNEGVFKNRVYFSTDFGSSTGEVIPPDPSLPNWPIWDISPNDTIRFNNYFGRYVNETGQRTRAVHAKGPAFISEEDIFSVYKDTDLSRYEGGAAQRRSEGYPLGMQIEQTVYSWGFGDYGDFIFLKYLFVHPRQYPDTLLNCWMGALLDVDIALTTNPIRGAFNDRSRYYGEEPDLNLALQWTNGDAGEGGMGFGYLGFNFLESPAVDADGFLRKDKRKFPVAEQLGLVTVQDWPSSLDKRTNEERYDFLSERRKESIASEPGDRRMLMSTGPFNMSPGDSARIVMGVVMAATSGGGDADGTTEDLVEIIRKVRFAQSVYDNNFNAPTPPDRSRIMGFKTPRSPFDIPAEGWLPLDNAIAIQWDSTAELSVDTLEKGMDFLGYRVYRSRNPDLDTFNIDNIETQRRGPLGWKQLAVYGMPTPFLKRTEVAGNTGTRIDDFMLANPVSSTDRRFLVLRTPSFAEPWREMWSNLLRPLNRPTLFYYPRLADGRIDISRLSRADSMAMCFLVVPDDIPMPLVGVIPITPQTPSNDSAVLNQTLQLNPQQSIAWRDSVLKLIANRQVLIEEFRFRDTESFDSAGQKVTRVIFRPWQELSTTRNEIIAPFMNRVTTGRTFIDYGDDNRDGIVSYSTNPNLSERLINNVDYYYAVRAYDEGDWSLPSPTKLNGKSFGLSNVVKVRPRAPRPGGSSDLQVVISDSDRAKLGGLFNFRFHVRDENRFKQMYAGRTLELEFYRTWNRTSDSRVTRPSEPDFNGLYGVAMFMRDSASKRVMGAWSSLFPSELCPSTSVFTLTGGAPGFFTEKTRSWADADSVRVDTVFTEPIRFDTITIGLPGSREKVNRTGSYTTVASCFGANQYAEGLIGFSFDYDIQQWGGVYRFDTATVQSGPQDLYVGEGEATPATYSEDAITLPYPYQEGNSSADAFTPIGVRQFLVNFPQSFNNGPGIYEVEFLPGGTETITASFDPRSSEGTDPITRTFQNVPYLNMSIRNVLTYDRVNTDGSTTTVSYDTPIQASGLRVGAAVLDYPDLRKLPVGQFNMASYGWRNTRERILPASRRAYAANNNSGRPVGNPDRYYLSRALSSDGRDTLDFAHVLNIAGVQFSIDFSWQGRRNTQSALRPLIPAPSQLPRQDFKAGDKIVLSTFGGAFGYPLDGAKVYARVGQYDPEIQGRSLTQDDLEKVQVSPNPYIVSHEGIQSPFQGAIYFTSLPRECTIDIYTSSGSLIRTIQHSETTASKPTETAVEVWNLLSRNLQRVASQLLIAKISTPNGVTVTRKFTVLVGPARIIGATN